MNTTGEKNTPPCFNLIPGNVYKSLNTGQTRNKKTIFDVELKFKLKITGVNSN